MAMQKSFFPCKFIYLYVNKLHVVMETNNLNVLKMVLMSNIVLK